MNPFKKTYFLKGRAVLLDLPCKHLDPNEIYLMRLTINIPDNPVCSLTYHQRLTACLTPNVYRGLSMATRPQFIEAYRWPYTQYLSRLNAGLTPNIYRSPHAQSMFI